MPNEAMMPSEDKPHFAIGLGMWAVGVGAGASFVIAFIDRRPIFLWICLGLELVIPLLWATKKPLRAMSDKENNYGTRRKWVYWVLRDPTVGRDTRRGRNS